MPGKIKFRIKITEIIIITKTSSTIDDDIRSNVTLHTHTYRTCHDHLQFTPMNEIPTLFCHPIRSTSHCLWLEKKYLSNPFYLMTEIFTSSSPRPHCALNGPLSSRTHLPWTFSQEEVSKHPVYSYHNPVESRGLNVESGLKKSSKKSFKSRRTLSFFSIKWKV